MRKLCVLAAVAFILGGCSALNRRLTTIYPQTDAGFAAAAQGALTDAEIASAYKNGDLMVPESDKYRAIALIERGVVFTRQDAIADVLSQFDGVEAARVQLSQTDERSCAAVSLETSRVLTAEEGLALAAAVAKSVEGLALTDVAILDQDYNVVYDGASE